MIQRNSFLLQQLVMLAPASAFRGPYEPPLAIGNVVALNSGGPHSVVVDLDGASVTVAWRDGDDCHEMTAPAACFHRVEHGHNPA